MEEKMKEWESIERVTDEEKQFNRLFEVLRRGELLRIAAQETRFSATEIRLIGEILNAKYIGKRLISTQLAKRLSVTRSAISQLVNRLEVQGVLRRVADEVDRKIAYIELTDEAFHVYKKDFAVYVKSVGEVVEQFGAERFDKMCELFDEFYELMKAKKVK